ncbi:CehA/McbA family metallohydrolase domain-containing protein [Mucilaginibacter myungsuensis]|uniref:Uncharacterized protein n=1 Tax=Mucilaginibacter myungsuensis TaxID=649104 RepID=A0A929KUU6_9SPHI|nr:hypothetical protein [Mucilaginibacter myungsuensis]MBE9661587.1 hypothetical protein [Mucilaginibacter myungsuensis]MDN3597732.1 hypothetical protein [Mucilaginibacter myungsuensis]
MKKVFLALSCLLASGLAIGQVKVDYTHFNKNGAAKVAVSKDLITLSWPGNTGTTAQLVLDMNKDKALFNAIKLSGKTGVKTIAGNLDPAFILTIGKRTLDPKSGGWDVFFDRVPTKPYKAHNVSFDKTSASVSSNGSKTTIRIGEMASSTFKGALEIIVYDGSPMFNVAAVLATQKDSTAIIYDAGLVSKQQPWDNISWEDVRERMQVRKAVQTETSKNLEVKYRTVIGQTKQGSLALFPAPHQYFYPLDEAFNLRFTWYGSNYRDMIPEFGIGIRQELEGDKRYVPWFNAPPNTQQRLNFFCLIDQGTPTAALSQVKKFTHNDTFKPLPGYKTMESHFHNEFISSVALTNKPAPEEPNFVKIFKDMGVNIVHLGEFHGPGHPKGPDDARLRELDALFKECERLSTDNFLLLPGEEANNFYGGHWMSFFPKPVYWVMSRKDEQPYVSQHPKYGKVYHIGNKEEMLKLMEEEKGLAWVAHARTKGSTGYPDAYKDEAFFRSDTYMGAAWKAIPADLSTPTQARRVLNLLDDMNNWGLKKHVISECDIFTIEPENEMYAHLNINYLKMDKMPTHKTGWQPVLDVMSQGKFFSSTGEVLIPSFTVSGRNSGETLALPADGNVNVVFSLDWTYPMNFAEIISGDGSKVYHDRIDLNDTRAFGTRTITKKLNLKGRTWVRLEAWDTATNGAFTQTVYLK